MTRISQRLVSAVTGDCRKATDRMTVAGAQPYLSESEFQRLEQALAADPFWMEDWNSLSVSVALPILVEEIEKLFVGVGWSRGALNVFGKPHFVLTNGVEKPEAAPCAPWPGSLKRACQLTLAEIKARLTPGEHYWLIWRDEPAVEMDERTAGVQLRLRLSIERERPEVEQSPA